MPIDPNVFDKIKTFGDYQKADQAFQLQKSLQQQALQTGGLDQQAKQLSLVGQIVGNNSIDQDSYDRARQVANSQGLDVSALPDQFNPDVVNRLRFAGATPTAQLSAMLQQNQMALRAGTATGNIGAYGYGSGLGGLPSQNNPQAPAPQTDIAGTAPQAGNKNMTPDQQAQAMRDLYPQDNSPAPSPANTPAAPVSTPQFSFRPQNQGETIDAYKAAQQQAFDQFKLNNAGQIKQTEAAGSETGKLTVENSEMAKKADELTKRLEMNLNAMMQLNPNVPSTGFIPGSWKAAGDQALSANGFGSGDTAKAANQWDQINNQQILSEIQQFIASGGANTRTNQTLERIVRAASGINRNDLPASREAQINNALAEIKNKNVSAQNLAGGNEAYSAVPVVTSQPNTPKPGDTLQGTDGAYLFNGGDPSQQSNWKKIK